MSDDSVNPYPGPRSFAEVEADLFFGRESEAERLLAMVISQRLVLFTAQSGAGKSSLVNTRLLPGLRREGFETLPVGRVSGVLPAGVTDVHNIFGFNLIITLDGGRQPATELSRFKLRDYLGSRERDQRETGEPEVARALVIDQFEEILTSHLERWREREAFFHQLRDALRADPLLWVVLVMREDHAAALDPYARLLPGKLRTRFYMQRMEPKWALVAVREPAGQKGCPFGDGVAEKLVENLCLIRVEGREEPIKSQFVEPVHLQLVCHQLWKNLQAQQEMPAEISHDDLTELGDVDTALAQFFEQAVRNTLNEVGGSEIELYRWFKDKLITETGTRGTVYRGARSTAGLENEAVDSLVRQFLLRSESRAGGTWYELSHDRFVQPILRACATWTQRQDSLTQAALEWDQAGRNRRFLYGSGQLERARAGIEGETPEPLVREFLEAAERASEEVEGELEAARKLKRMATWLVAVVGGLALNYLLLAGFVVWLVFDMILEQEEGGEEVVVEEVVLGAVGSFAILVLTFALGMLIGRALLALYRGITVRRRVERERLRILGAKLGLEKARQRAPAFGTRPR